MNNKNENASSDIWFAGKGRSDIQARQLRFTRQKRTCCRIQLLVRCFFLIGTPLLFWCAEDLSKKEKWNAEITQGKEREWMEEGETRSNENKSLGRGRAHETGWNKSGSRLDQFHILICFWFSKISPQRLQRTCVFFRIVIVQHCPGSSAGQ